MSHDALVSTGLAEDGRGQRVHGQRLSFLGRVRRAVGGRLEDRGDDGETQEASQASGSDVTVKTEKRSCLCLHPDFSCQHLLA